MNAKIILSVLAIAALAGCASNSYKQYADMNVSIHTAYANAEAEKYRAMANIAKDSDSTTRVAALMSMQQNGSVQKQMAFAAPKSTSEVVREWLGLILPVAVQGYGIHANQNIAVTQSNNSRDVAVSTNSAFVGMAQQIQAPTVTIGGDGSVSNSGAASMATTDSRNPVETSYSNNPVTNP